MNQLFVLTDGLPSGLDDAFIRLAKWMGLNPQCLAFTDPHTLHEELRRADQHMPACVALSADTLIKLSDPAKGGFSRAPLCGGHPVRCFVYGWSHSPPHALALNTLAGRFVSGPHHLAAGLYRFRFSAKREARLHQLTGLEFIDTAEAPCEVFDVAPTAGDAVTPLLFADDRPVFVRIEAGLGNDLFLWATNEIADIDAPIRREADLGNYYRSLLPPLLFLKACFESHCWHSPYPRARLIIDDPPLHARYGFLRYSDLLDSMNRTSYGTSIAFIPWNFRRSQQPTADLFIRHPHQLTLCLHGCDHSNHEFDTANAYQLALKAEQALQRMQEHHTRCGVPCERIMVFPQGHFSEAAIHALRTAGYLAAVNSHCHPSHGHTVLPLGEVLRPAMCLLYGFPIFLRRDPARTIDIAVDLFLGKAGFFAEHHDFVRDGYGTWEEFARRANALDSALQWPPLATTVTESCLQRAIDEDQMEIRFFTHMFRWRNNGARLVQARFWKFEPDLSVVSEVRVNGESHPFYAEQERLHFHSPVPPGATVEIMVLDRPSFPLPSPTPSISYSIGIALRRYMSEFRDNVLVKHPAMFRYAQAVARRLGLTSESRAGAAARWSEECGRDQTTAESTEVNRHED